jgi:hypothetical protein
MFDFINQLFDEIKHIASAIYVMAGHSRPKDGVASARLCPGHPRLPSIQ